MPKLIELERDLERQFELEGLDCLIEYREEDPITGIQYRDCVIDHTRCPNQRCIKKLI